MSKQPSSDTFNTDRLIAHCVSDTYLYQSSIIDEHGREVPITRDMIRRACDKFEENVANYTYALLQY